MKRRSFIKGLAISFPGLFLPSIPGHYVWKDTLLIPEPRPLIAEIEVIVNQRYWEEHEQRLTGLDAIKKLQEVEAFFKEGTPTLFYPGNPMDALDRLAVPLPYA